MPVAIPTREILLKLAQELPASPQILQRLDELIEDPNVSLEDIARLLRRDASLSARIIRISNSVAYGGSGIASVEDAVSRVGFTEVYRLTGLAAASQLEEHHLTFYAHDGRRLRDNTLVTAMAAEIIARRIDMDPRAVYAAALLRSMGKMVLERFVRRHLSPEKHYSRSGVATLLTWERELVGVVNPDVAAAILETWNFPPSITDPVRQQYLVSAPAGPHARTAIVLNIAAGIACDSGYSLPGEATYWELTMGKLADVGLNPTDVTPLVEETQAAFESIRESI
jgi:HD-like signal output (HDOD) protein